MVEQDWIRGRACQRCYTQKLKCRRPPGHAICVRCARLHAECRPRPPKDRHDESDTLKLRSPHIPHSRPAQSSSFEQSMSAGSNDTDPFALFTPDLSVADVPTGSTVQPLTGSGIEIDWQTPFVQIATSTSAKIPESMPTTVLPLLSNAETRSTGTDQSHLERWVHDVAHLNSSICALQQRPDFISRLTLPTKTEVETIFHLTLEFSALVSALHIEGSTPAAQGTHSQSAKGVSCASDSSASTQAQMRIKQILADPSNVLLLTSVYNRLLSLLHAMINYCQNHPNSPQLDLKVGLVDLGDRPVMQSLIAVNVIELLIRRVDRILGLSNEDASTTASQTPSFSAAGRQHEDRSKGFSMVLDMTRKQQKDLLEAAGSLRAQLLRPACW